jgi:lipid II:glycine glycyltransferase (peptidoglycan interpeptide bridge formation enzyme)
MIPVTAATATATDVPASGVPMPGGRPDADRLRGSADAWDAFVAGAPNGSFPQLSAWAEANATKGWSAHRVVADTPDGPVGAQLLVHRMRPGPWSRAYAPRGPVARAVDRGAIAAFTDAARAAARTLRLVHLTVDPELEAGSPVEGWLRGAGWRPIGPIQIDRTRIIDLARPEAELWGDLRSSARWSVSKSRRSGFVVTEPGEAGLGDFERLYLETARRVGFDPGAAFRAVYRAFARRAAARLLIASDAEGVPAATLVLLDCGDRVIELYGASSKAGAQGRANYLVKWEAIRSSAERGMARYDMWGTDEEGVATFKASFGGTERRYIGAWRLVTDPRAHAILSAAARVRGAAGAARDRAAALRPRGR